MVQQLGVNNQNQRLLAGRAGGRNRRRLLRTPLSPTSPKTLFVDGARVCHHYRGQSLLQHRAAAGDRAGNTVVPGRTVLLTFQNKQEQVYNIQPVNRDMEDEKEITEVFVREYVLLRSSFNRDIPEVEARWMPGGMIEEMSSPAVYKDFVENTANRALELIRTRQMIRDVRIMTVNELGSGIWQVEYETRDMYPDSKAPEINYWTASLKVGYRSKRVKFKGRLKNPVGFTVYQYSLTYNKVK